MGRMEGVHNLDCGMKWPDCGSGAAVVLVATQGACGPLTWPLTPGAAGTGPRMAGTGRWCTDPGRDTEGGPAQMKAWPG